LNRPAQVLVVGAGPTGLVLALWLRRLGIGVRIIDQTSEPGTTSRALAVHARTLELYDQIGLARDVVERGLEFAAVNLWVRGKQVGRAAFGDIGRGMSPFPYVVMFPQDQHERLLIEWLRRSGVEVERSTSLVGFEERDGHFLARLRLPDGAESGCTVAYVAGCDGAHSRTREVLGIGFPGGTYERLFYVADVELRGPVANHELHVALDAADLLAIFPMKGANAARLIGTVRREAEARREELTWDDVSQLAMQRMQMTVDRVHWFSTYKVHHRVATRFGRGRAFLLGDAAHVHSPVGGQGMNTGIGDAINLAWKLAAVLRGRATGELLATYEVERKAFAERLVATTDRAFTFVTRDGPIARFVRLDAVPAVLPAISASTAFRRLLYRTVSQTSIQYRPSALSEGRVGFVHGGDRLPWVPPERGMAADNFAPLRSLDWQVHVYGSPSRALERACAELGLPCHAFAWNAGALGAGLVRGAAYLVRPDGYIALADASASPAHLKSYLRSRGIQTNTERAPLQSDMIQS
jgi:2-polyprenyl-6-methoxyphenol hydroxylase-like FAD-dependent oxidoreductase